MELVEGTTLKEYIQAHGRIEPMQAIDFAIQIAQGLQAAHEHHTIHRDIKPQNIIMSNNGTLKVTDFGIARAASSSTTTTNAMGSVHYRSRQEAATVMREVIFIHSVSPCMRCSQDMFHLKARTMWL